jgi:hypothetical protein
VLIGGGLSTLLVSNHSIPAMATLVGTNQFASFPLLPYAGWFFAGIALGRQGGEVRLWHLGVGSVMTLGYFVYLVLMGKGPERFPPSVLWVAGPALFLLVYLAAAKSVISRLSLPVWALLPGQHVLSMLLLSNLLIFLIRFLFGQPVTSVWSWLGATTLLVLLPCLFRHLADRARAFRPARTRPETV